MPSSAGLSYRYAHDLSVGERADCRAVHEHREVVDTGGESGRPQRRIRSAARSDRRPRRRRAWRRRALRAPRNGPVRLSPGFGYAHTWTASTPLPLAAARSVAHPATMNGWPTVWLLPGVSIDMRGLAFTWTVTVREIDECSGERRMRECHDLVNGGRQAFDGEAVTGAGELAPKPRRCRDATRRCVPVRYTPPLRPTPGSDSPRRR